MADYLKLTEPGSSVTFVVKTVTVSTTGSWPDLHFVSERGETIIAPKNAMDRQLEKMKLADWQQTVGMALTISRSTTLGKNGKPFWDCALAAGGYVEPTRPSLTVAAKAEAEKVRVAKGLPPDDDREIPPPTDADSPNAGPSVAQQATNEPEAIDPKEARINAAYTRAWGMALAVQDGVGTPESVQAGAATLLIAYGRAGIC